MSTPTAQRDRHAPCYLSLAGSDWWVHGRAHANMQVMIELSKRHKVLIVNSIGMRFPGRATSGRRTRILRKAKSMLRFLRRPLADRPNLWVYSPVFLPAFGRTGRKVNSLLISAQVRAVCLALRIRRPWCMVVNPAFAAVADRLNFDNRFYYRSDDHAATGDVSRTDVRRLEDRLMEASRFIVYSNRWLMDAETERHKGKGVWIDHGVDLDHFSPPTNPTGTVGFFGLIEDEAFDVELVTLLARSLPETSFVFAGRVAMDVSELEALPNVSFRGFVPYEKLPDLARGFDVAINPMPNSTWVRAANPIKLKEYLALGLPVVATWTPELERMDDVVALAKSPEEFLSLIEDALNGRGVSSPEARRQSVAGDSWGARAEVIEQLTLGARAALIKNDAHATERRFARW